MIRRLRFAIRLWRLGFKPARAWQLTKGFEP